jgi:dipeptidyl aminopeptidase/acylaminoacyl peptidase
MKYRAFLFRPDGTGPVETAVPASSAVLSSPDGKQIAGTRPAGNHREVYVADADGSNARRVSPEGTPAEAPCWSPDGRRVAFVARIDDRMQVHVADRDESNVRKLTDGPHGARFPKFGADGRLGYLLMGQPEFKREPADLVILDDRTGTNTTLTKETLLTDFAWSPDGTTIAYGKPEALVFHDLRSGKAQEVPFATLDPKLTHFAAFHIGWSPDGRAVACRMVFWGGRRANGPKMLGDEEVFVFPRAGKPYWFAAGGEVGRVEWLAGKPPAAVEIRGADGVLLATDEIRAYDWDTHTLTLVPKARERLAAGLRQTGSLVRGVPFTVAVDGKAVYAGKFTSVVSSAVIKGPVIVVDLPTLDEKLGADQLRIEIGYPGKIGDDPDVRPDRRVRDALEASGRLKKTG